MWFAYEVEVESSVEDGRKITRSAQHVAVSAIVTPTMNPIAIRDVMASPLKLNQHDKVRKAFRKILAFSLYLSKVVTVTR